MQVPVVDRYGKGIIWIELDNYPTTDTRPIGTPGRSNSLAIAIREYGNEYIVSPSGYWVPINPRGWQLSAPLGTHLRIEAAIARMEARTVAVRMYTKTDRMIRGKPVISEGWFAT